MYGRIEGAEALTGRIPDRRKRPRLAVQWPLQLWRVAEHVLETFTINVSSSGFYYPSTQPFSVGESLVALLEIPGAAADREFQNVVLRCEVIVLRVEMLVDTRNYGVACRVTDYSVLTRDPSSAAFG